MKKLVRFLPFIIFISLGVIFYSQLGKNSQELPSALVGKKVPDFKLVSLVENTLQTNSDLPKEAYLINFWGTWCPACHLEHPFLNQLALQGVTILGIDYKDDAEQARQWLSEKGNPYIDVLMDETGVFGLDMGVTGAPETFIIDSNGIVVHRHQGPLNAQNWSTIKGFLK
ncbi:DsbE family thiol:disulfide interchange protein [Marinomonas sp. C2222]|uniref:DsbE family thiol:disulfide interchange protein n=1 Tax=Marinomonas sargassi TaxID=2984494 RepID=A0ABT2YNA1_9GAMM|nr:DsbE family thiol:disulfide interchange protein [Marinomonas sargassi]MCV2401359.1 DsbE family thiol:disulfide interchange protein [Marinomonas sargassi]